MIRLAIHNIVRQRVDVRRRKPLQRSRINPMRQPVPLQRARNPRFINAGLCYGKSLRAFIPSRR